MAAAKEQRASMKFIFLLGKTVVKTVGILQTAWKDVAMSKTHVSDWLLRFKHGHSSLENQPRSG